MPRPIFFFWGGGGEKFEAMRGGGVVFFRGYPFLSTHVWRAFWRVPTYPFSTLPLRIGGLDRGVEALVLVEGKLAVVVKTNGIPFWGNVFDPVLVGIGMFTGANRDFDPWPNENPPTSKPPTEANRLSVWL